MSSLQLAAHRCVQLQARHTDPEVGCTTRRLYSPAGLPIPPSASPPVSLAAPLGLPSLCPFPPPTLSGPTPFGLDTPPRHEHGSLTNCVHASVPTTSTFAPCTTLAWMKTTSPEGALPKPNPLLTNHLSTVSLTTLAWSVKLRQSNVRGVFSSWRDGSQQQQEKRIK